MPKIRQLPPHIVAQIAAGEVIERPAFAVKELIENAIDAKADEIIIRIENAGLKKIQVIDNGEGMEKEDLENAWKPHTTSKITEADSLIGIKSFGFRGEALASLAAVSRLTIQSRTKKNVIGNEITIQDGKKITSNPIGMPQGTIITAENLFTNIPARKKFLKSSQTEIRHIIEIVIQFIATYPNIHFSLQHNRRVIFDTPKTDNNESRLPILLGKNIMQFLLPIKRNDSYIKISGFVAKPQVHSTTTAKQFLFVNKRKVTDKLLSLAVKEAFGTMLEATTYPAFILFLELPYDLVDVNVHPRKEQVAFINSQSIFQFVKETTTETLQENNITFQNLSWKRIGVGTTNSYAAGILRENVLEKEKFTIELTQQPTQLHNLYIIAQTKQGVIFVDQHAAHERILFEKLKSEFIKQKGKGLGKKLQKPIRLTLSLPQQELIKEYQKTLHTIGFTFKKDFITHVPLLFQDRNPNEMIEEFLNTLNEQSSLQTIDKTSEEMLAFLACRAAVKAGDILEVQQQKKILKELQQAPNNATCPHGRPTQMFFPLKDINHLFYR